MLDIVSSIEIDMEAQGSLVHGGLINFGFASFNGTAVPNARSSRFRKNLGAIHYFSSGV